MKKYKKSISILLVISILMSVCPLKSFASWRDHSGDLPGMVSDSQVGTQVVIGVVVALGVGVIIALLVKPKKKVIPTTKSINKNDSITSSFDNELNDSILWTNKIQTKSKSKFSNPESQQCKKEKSFMNKIETASHSMPVQLLISPNSMYNDVVKLDSKGIQ